MVNFFDVIVIGSGLSGLSCARSLADNGKTVCVLDANPRSGGRILSKSVDLPKGTATFDLGAQYFTVDELIFQKQVNLWLKAGIVEKWATTFATNQSSFERESRVRYKVLPNMNQLSLEMAKGLDVRQNQLVSKLYYQENHQWMVESQSGLKVQSKTLIISAPLPDALVLCYKSGIIPEDKTVSSINPLAYHSCIALSIASDSESLIPEPGGLWFESTHPIRWIADNKKKGVSEVTAVTVHLSPTFSAQHFNEPEHYFFTELEKDLKELIPGNWIYKDVHRWKFSQPVNIVSLSFLKDEYYKGLWFTGDAFLNGRVESAWMAGYHTAIEVSKSLL